MSKREAIYRDFSEMPVEVLDQFNAKLYEVSQKAALKLRRALKTALREVEK